MHELSEADVIAVIRRSLHPRLDSDQIADFCASVDWSYTDDEISPAGRLIGRLHLETTEYQEGMLPESEYVDYLLCLLPEDERARLASAPRD